MTTYPKAGHITGHLEPVPSYDEYMRAWRAVSLAYVGTHTRRMDKQAGMDVLARIPDHVKHEYTIKRLKAAEKDFAEMGLMGPETRERVQRILELMEQGTDHVTAAFQAKEEHEARAQKAMDAALNAAPTMTPHHDERRHDLDTAPSRTSWGIRGLLWYMGVGAATGFIIGVIRLWCS